MLRAKLGNKRLLLSDNQRRRLAVKGCVLGRKALQEIATIVTPDTILRRHISRWPSRRLRNMAVIGVREARLALEGVSLSAGR